MLNARRVLALSLLALGGCGAGRGATGVLGPEGGRYRVGAIGAGWRPVAVDGAVDAAWHHEGLAAVVEVKASCSPAHDIPLVALTNHLLVGFTERVVDAQETVPFAGREALRTRVTAKLDGVPRALLLVVLKKDGCVYDFLLAAPPGRAFDAAVASLEHVTAGFQTEGRAP